MMAGLLAAGMLALIIALLLGALIINLLTNLNLGQTIREDGPPNHLQKEGLPTMGGIIILLALVLALLFTTSLTENLLWLFLVTLGFGLIGLLDDLIKILEERSLGLKAWQKLCGQLLLALLISFHVAGLPGGDTLRLPFTAHTLELGYLYLPFAILVVVGTANAVNLTDGLDGLAAGITVLVSLGFTIISVLIGVYDLAIFSISLAGACLGFLWYNGYPAKVIMGDTGSLALGGALAGLALLSKTELFLFIMGGVFVLETLSVIIQVISFRSTGKRVFAMSPIHHHFELVGWKEPKIVIRFFIFSCLLLFLGLLGMVLHLQY